VDWNPHWACGRDQEWTQLDWTHRSSSSTTCSVLTVRLDIVNQQLLAPCIFDAPLAG
jgi:hypothetical protein